MHGSGLTRLALCMIRYGLKFPLCSLNNLTINKYPFHYYLLVMLFIAATSWRSKYSCCIIFWIIDLSLIVENLLIYLNHHFLILYQFGYGLHLTIVHYDCFMITLILLFGRQIHNSSVML